MNPRVSYVMAVYNGEATIHPAVESILTQTFQDFELILIDDGSTDTTPAILRHILDPRARILRNEKNRGLSAALNCGLDSARGEFIARMDADDLSLPNRTALQTAYLDQNPAVAIVGAWIETFSNNTPGALIKYPADPGPATALLFRSALAHPAVMFRRQILADLNLRYEPEFRYAQDYALWLNCVAKGLRIANLPQVLLRYRLHEGQLSASMDKMQAEGTVIRNRFLQWFVQNITPEELALHERLSRDFLLPDAPWLTAAANWLQKLARINDQRQLFDHEPLLRTLTGRYVALTRLARQHHLPPPQAAIFDPYVI